MLWCTPTTRWNVWTSFLDFHSNLLLSCAYQIILKSLCSWIHSKYQIKVSTFTRRFPSDNLQASVPGIEETTSFVWLLMKAAFVLASGQLDITMRKNTWWWVFFVGGVVSPDAACHSWIPFNRTYPSLQMTSIIRFRLILMVGLLSSFATSCF